MPSVVRVLLLADTHLGFDLPFRPRVQRRRRGYDFFANTERALLPALRREVDLVVHGGDLLYRSRVPPTLVEMALAPFIRVAESGVPVFLVPGNHERSHIPLNLWALHPNLLVFDRPRTFVYRLAAGSIALSGWPYAREVRDSFRSLVADCGQSGASADVRLLCIHQVVEGARVGPADFTFRSGPDIVRGRDLPGSFDAVLAGHIHRAQVLERDLAGRRLAAPVIYPGAVERTAFAERDEAKGYRLVTVSLSGQGADGRVRTEFVPLPARPMILLRWEPDAAGSESWRVALARQIALLDPESVVRLDLWGEHAPAARDWLGAERLRRLAPATMNIELAPERAGVSAHLTTASRARPKEG